MTLIVFALVLWAVLAGVLAISAVHWVTRRQQEFKARAYREILIEKGVEPKPDETIGQALKRARRTELNRSNPPPSDRPLPAFAKTLQRPKSRPAWTSEPRSTQHVGGHTPGSSPPSEAVQPYRRRLPSHHE